MTAEPIPVRVLRHRCPFCGRTASRPVRAREHIARCWHNPEARGCKTCKHFEQMHGGEPDYCDAGVDLTGRPQCGNCHGFGDVPGEDLGMTECPDCGGDGAEIKPGPIVGCDRWEPDDRCWHGDDCDGEWPDCEPNNPTAARLAAETEDS